MGSPLWLRAYHSVEGTVGPRIEQLAHGQGFSTTLVVVQRVKRGVQGQVERRTRQAWHLLNLPAGSDLQRLRGQIGDLDHEVRSLRSSLEKGQRDQARRDRSTGDG